MATGTGLPVFCLKHNPKWRNKFQEFLNKISGPTRRNPLICESDVKRITKVVCPCENGPNQAWRSITPDKIMECHNIYTHSSAYEGSIHKEFYERVKQLNLFTGNGNGSADRLIYILSNKLLPVGHERDDILERICPIKQRPPGDPIHIGSLKEAHTGRFFGRGGTGIREAVHGIPVGNITIDIRQITNSDMVEARATFSCRPRHIQQVLEGLRQRVGYYVDNTPVPLRARQQHGRGGHQSMDM
ncbi:uncharacterized protein LOC127702169 [Mytilus californianus]|uniref:uncharacterized protein LOC127702169 n=1 Tax=Mytilus californianus TaxID=6549 RepID=UPI002246F76B|nr:uncharacterized protein LOC127702169 [Mytilus californianus]